jgi:ribosomal protein L11 methylase PrmA
LRFSPGPGAGTLQDMLYAELDAFEPVAIHEHESGDGWRVFFPTPAQRDGARRALASEFENALELHAIDVDDEDWARRSQAALRAVRAGRLVIAPPWDVPDARDSSFDQAQDDPEALEGSRFAIRDSKNQESQSGKSKREPRPATRDPGISNHEPRTASRDSGTSTREPRTASRDSGTSTREPRTASRDIVVIIDPSTGFGTGHHATTRLCLELLQQVDLRGKRVVDVGTGSGVLAIAAAKLGARDVIGIDNDPDALRNARDNVERNGAVIELLEGDLARISVVPADVVLANLTSAVLQRLADSLKRLVKTGGVLIVSGFSADDLDDVARALIPARFEPAQQDEWAAAILTIGT